MGLALRCKDALIFQRTCEVEFLKAMSFKQQIVVDGRGHMFGRLASLVAKELLNGQKVVIVRTEDVNMSGSLYRAQLKYANFKRKKTNSNPKHGPLHYRAPGKILWRCVRGMVLPAALKVLRLRPERRFCKLGDLSNGFGWKYKDLMNRLEGQRKITSEAFYKKKMAATRARATAVKKVKVSADDQKILAAAGFS